MEFTLQAHQLSSQRGQKILWQNLNFTVLPGEIYQIKGGNGSGKTSLLKILTGSLRPTTGTVRWCGRLIEKYRPEYYAKMCFLGHQSAIKPQLTILENLRRYSALRTAMDMDRWLEFFQLQGMVNLRCQQLSQGQTRRVALIRVLMSDVALWILDEPFAHLDRIMTKKLLTHFNQHAQQGGAIILATHQALKFNSPTQVLDLGAAHAD